MDRVRKYLAAAVQINAGEDKAVNLEKAERLIRQAAASGARLVVLPENAFYVGTGKPEQISESMDGPYATQMSRLAKELGIWLHAGSFAESNGTPRPYNTTLLFGPDGKCKGVYRKIHMFDVTLANGPSSRESDRKTPGKEVVGVTTELGKVGLTTCYDMRFPELYRRLAIEGSEVFICCACFTMNTGKDHWMPLLRARAIENGCYMIASGQIGKNYAFQCYGKSMIVDPWGDVIACCGDYEGFALGMIDLDYVQHVRQQIPSLSNRRTDVFDGIESR